MNARIEAAEHYQKALKAGRKIQRQRIHQGLYPYLEVLDEILEDYETSGQEELGVIEIPADKIVGTKTRGRSDAFAANFLPLIGDKSEFSMKWQNLCQYHLGEAGIRDPIFCYEFLGRFYVQEGNKRVSVLKYFDAASIRGKVIRILPLTLLYTNYQKAAGALSQLRPAEKQLTDAIAKIDDGITTLQEELTNLHHAESRLWISWGEWGQGRDELEDGWNEYEEAQVEFHKEIVDDQAVLKDAEAELKDAREEIDSMDQPDLIRLSRTSNVGYSNLESSSNIVAGVARVLPVFFLLVASLVCITTMTPMIDEERTQIGTLKALGYTNGEDLL